MRASTVEELSRVRWKKMLTREVRDEGERWERERKGISLYRESTGRRWIGSFPSRDEVPGEKKLYKSVGRSESFTMVKK